MFETDGPELETQDEVNAEGEESSAENAEETLEVAAENGEGVDPSDVAMTDTITDLAPDTSEAPADEAPPLEFVDSFRMFSILESLLFASDRPVSLATFKEVFKGTTIDTKTLKRALEELQVLFADPTRGVTLEEVTGGWQLRSKLDNMDFLKKISKARPFKLSGPSLEVLSIIAYKQPIVKNEIDQIRGVESGHLVRALMEKGLVSFEGKTDLPGKPMAYSTTRKFLEIFGLRNLNELPTLSEIDQLLPDGIGEAEEKETLSDVTAMMSKEITSTYSEGEEELTQITDKINAIDTSSEFFETEKQRQKEKRDREKAEDIREALAMGEAVESKDVKWLERYEAQQALAAEAAAQAVAQAAAQAQAEAHLKAIAQAEGEATQVANELEALTAESDLEAVTDATSDDEVAAMDADGEEELEAADTLPDASEATFEALDLSHANELDAALANEVSASSIDPRAEEADGEDLAKVEDDDSVVGLAAAAAQASALFDDSDDEGTTH